MIDFIENTFAEIPQPPTKLMVGNLLDIKPGAPVQSLMQQAREYGSIFQLGLPNRKPVFVSGYELVNELCDEERFDKKVWRPLQTVRSFAGDGLFTAHTQEPNWRKAHNILLPNFSQQAMKSYFPMMLDIAEQMLEKWERLNADEEIDVANDMTRLTLDTIGLCGFDYRFNSFYKEEMHPFVQSMVRSLGESMERGRRLSIQHKLMIHRRHQFQADAELMNSVVDQVICERKAKGDYGDKKDLLSYMLSGVDKQTGEKLDDINIRYQIITFLIAGHETTSGLLSFALYFLLQHPEVLQQAYEEVDRVLGPDPTVQPTYAQINALHYVTQILLETLRLWPTAPLFAVYPYEDTVIGGKYKVNKAQELAVIIPMLHRDTSVWGEDAEKFNPDHFSHEAEAARPANAYKPFGNGQRACIGRQFAMQEATLVLGMLLQRFKLIDHTHYQLKVKESLTLKPEGFTVQVRKRTDADHTIVPVPDMVQPAERTVSVAEPAIVYQHETPLLVLYGSNLGTAKNLAHQIGEDARARGFQASVAELDASVNKLPQEGAVVIVTSSYNGTPPDNAAQFCEWLKHGQLAPNALQGVKYTVFGCGNRDWAATFQAIPRLVDSSLEQYGAQRIYQCGEGDARDDLDGQFLAWYRPLWQALTSAFSTAIETETLAAANKGRFVVELLQEEQALNPFVVSSFGNQAMRVVANCELAAASAGRSVRHLELALPEGITYQTGDHLGVIARNSEAQVRRVAARFNFTPETKIRLQQSSHRKTHLPLGEPIRVFDLLAGYVELQEVATRAQIKAMIEHTECPPEKMQLAALTGNDEASVSRYRAEVLVKRKSLIDLLEEFQACTMPFHIYLELLSALRTRYYSISSSPLQTADRCSITVSVVKAPARSGHGEFEGVCSNYLSRQKVDEMVLASVINTKSPFRLPEDSRTPLIMVGSGTGLAPFRGFLQERAALKAQNKEVGPSLLFFGSRHSQQDFLYEQDLKDFVEQGITKLYTAFSREDAQCKVYVQDAILQHKDEVWQLLEKHAAIYVCGDASKMVPDVRRIIAHIHQEKTGASEQNAEQWLQTLTTQQRYLVDVWSN